MNTEQDFNGWTNRETWATALWINNDQGLYYHALDMANGYEDDKEGLAEAIEEWVTELLDMEEVLSAPPAQRKELISMSSDIGSLFRVNWQEIADTFIEESATV